LNRDHLRTFGLRDYNEGEKVPSGFQQNTPENQGKKGARVRRKERTAILGLTTLSRGGSRSEDGGLTGGDRLKKRPKTGHELAMPVARNRKSRQPKSTRGSSEIQKLKASSEGKKREAEGVEPKKASYHLQHRIQGGVT